MKEIIKSNGKFWHYISDSNIEYLSMGNIAVGFKPDTNEAVRIECSTSAFNMQEGFELVIVIRYEDKAVQAAVFTGRDAGMKLIYSGHGKFNNMSEAEDYKEAAEAKGLRVVKEGI